MVLELEVRTVWRRWGLSGWKGTEDLVRWKRGDSV